MPQAVTIFHNPACSTSRKAVALLQEKDVAPNVVEYLKTGWTKPQLIELFAKAGLTPRQGLRTKGALAGELGLLDGASDEAILDAMVAHPVLVERPFVVTAKGAALGRPVEAILPLL